MYSKIIALEYKDDHVNFSIDFGKNGWILLFSSTFFVFLRKSDKYKIDYRDLNVLNIYTNMHKVQSIIISDSCLNIFST